MVPFVLDENRQYTPTAEYHYLNENEVKNVLILFIPESDTMDQVINGK